LQKEGIFNRFHFNALPLGLLKMGLFTTIAARRRSEGNEAPEDEEAAVLIAHQTCGLSENICLAAG